MQVLGVAGILAAGVYFVHQYAVPWVNEWRKKQHGTSQGGESSSKENQSDQLLLAKNLTSMEALLLELNSGLHNLSSRIDR